MEWIIALPVIVKVLVSLTLIMGLNRIINHMLIPMLAGTLLLAFWTGFSLKDIGSIALKETIAPGMLFFLTIVFMVIWLSRQMAETGVMKELVTLISQRISRRLSMAVLPAVIGFLPMPGGALFSAPLVDDCDRDKTVDPLLKTGINYWFRHIWEYWWPLYPGVLLAMELSGLEVWQFILLQFPLCLFSILGGYLFLLKKVENKEKSHRFPGFAKQFISLTMPILIIIGTYVLLQFILPLFHFPLIENLLRIKYVPVCMGVLLGIIYLQIKRPLPLQNWKKIILSSKTLIMLLLVCIVRLYGVFIEAPIPGGAPLVEQMRLEMEGVPVALVVTLIPFICGMVSGLAIGFVGASFPIVLSLLGPHPEAGLLFSTVALAYGSGYIGMILSPVHICLIVTNEYFETTLEKSLWLLIPPALVVMAGTGIISLLWR